jgi:single-stranded-DNA-specific exonuclease
VGALEETDLAHELGMKVVVTDHHTIPEHMPRAEAIVNPHRDDSEYPFKSLSGAGIVFKLGLGITRELRLPEESYLNAYLDLAAMGTIADVMPLVDENRILAKFGLERILDSKKPGLAALVSSSGIKEKARGKMKSWHVGFVLGPRLNASGRIDDAKLSLSLLLSQDSVQAFELAKRLEDLNETRKREQEQLVEEAIEKVLATGADRHSMILVSGERWHEGVLGIVAGRLRERFCRPVFVLSTDPETGWTKGSGRSVAGVNLAEAIRAHPDLVQGGGHALAAGISLQSQNLERVQEAMHAYASKFLTEDDFVPTADADLEVDAAEVDLRLLECLSRFEPFGVSNPEPTFVCRNVAVDQVVPTRNPDHPQIMIRPHGLAAMRAPAFGLGEALRRFTGGFSADLLFRPALDDYNGVARVKWEVRDLAPL